MKSFFLGTLVFIATCVIVLGGSYVLIQGYEKAGAYVSSCFQQETVEKHPKSITIYNAKKVIIKY